MDGLMIYGVSSFNNNIDFNDVFIMDDTIKDNTKTDAPLQLKEILWEVTNKCDKNCDYCGSKEVIDKCGPLSDDSILHIAEEISKSSVSQVILTGGEPGCLSNKLFSNIISILKTSDIDIKVVTNGLVFNNNMLHDTIKTYGLSINTLQDIEDAKNIELYAKTTIITNFGTHNIWDSKKIFEFATKYPLWQVQLTMGEYQLTADGIKFLREKIEEYRQTEKCTIVYADNLQYQHICTAGVKSCGITWDGNVVACLSERSYDKNMKIYGNVLKRSLIDIWYKEFVDIRFKCDRKCCRDYIEFPED